MKTCIKIKSRGLVLILAICELGMANLAIGDVVSALDGDWAAFATISGFHDVTDRNSTFQVRVLEVNGSATVAINPITIYFVVTNDSSAGDLQQHVWRLPVTVARVERVTGINSGVRVLAILDAIPDTGVKAKPVELIIHYALRNGRLKNVITVEREVPSSKW